MYFHYFKQLVQFVETRENDGRYLNDFGIIPLANHQKQSIKDVDGCKSRVKSKQSLNKKDSRNLAMSNKKKSKSPQQRRYWTSAQSNHHYRRRLLQQRRMEHTELHLK